MTNQDQSPRREAAFWSACWDGGVVGNFDTPLKSEVLIDVTSHEEPHGILDEDSYKATGEYHEWLGRVIAHDFLNSLESAAVGSCCPAWHYRFAADTVVGGTDWWTLGATGLQVSHWRGSFLVHVAGKCLGGIKLVFGVTPKEYFIANGIPFQGTLAAHSLGVPQA